MWQAFLHAARNETVLVALAMLLLTLSAYRALAARERENIERTTAIAAEGVTRGLALEIALRVRPIERLAMRLAKRPGTPRAEFDDEASLFMSAYAEYGSLEWIEPYDAQRTERAVRATPSYSLARGGRGVKVSAPVVGSSGIEGFVVGSFRVSELLEALARHTLPAGYVLSVTEGKQEIFRLPRGAPDMPAAAAQRVLDIYGVPWTLRVWPAPQSLADVRSIFPALVLAAGTLFSILVTLAVRLAARARADSRALAEANRRLETEIADRRQAAESLRQAHQTLKAIFDTSPVAIVGMSADGTVASWNRAAENTLGWSEREVQGRPLPFAGDETPESWRARARAGQPVHGFECTLHRRNGAAFDAEVWVAPQHAASGQISGFICMIADAGRRKQLERQLRESSKLDAVSRLAAGVAHNFNNLLAVITGYAHLVLEDLPPGGPLRGEIEEVLKAADRAARLTVQLLAFGRVQTVRPRIVDLN